ncbi:hypothetical protein GcM3_012048 [Golovinomyces cichoracearum]|uniref:Uncharacterized protein n=1 Tax=Golovinomyces cichoracearum TaxID=62708 RepID=A0A420J9K4_9PEZI|nr:hypothetical protein GcM3_012048 [Golovinomyces cichoracearum]
MKKNWTFRLLTETRFSIGETSSSKDERMTAPFNTPMMDILDLQVLILSRQSFLSQK